MQPPSHRHGARRALRPGRILVYLFLAVWFGLGVGYLGLRHYVWPRLDGWRPLIVQQLSSAAGRPVSIGRVVTGFEGLLPRVTLEEVALLDAEGEVAFSAPRITGVVSLRTLLAAQVRLAVLQFERPQVRIERLEPGLLRVAGFEIPLDSLDDGQALGWMLAQRRIQVREATVDWQDRSRGVRQRLQGIDATLGSVGRLHRVSVRFGVAPDAWQRLELAAEFQQPILTSAGDWQRWSGEFYFGADGVDLAGVRARWPVPAGMPEAAGGDLKVWGDFSEGRLDSVQAKLAGRAIDWVVGGVALRIDALDTEATLKPGESGREVRIQRLQARLPDGLKLTAIGEQRLRLDAEGRPETGQFAFDGFDAGAALAFARRLPLPAAAGERLRALNVTGRVSALSVRWNDAQAADFDAAVDFDRIALRHAPGAAQLPWFANLSGQARITPQGGELRVDSGPSTLAFPGIFAEPAIGLRALKADARWSFQTDGDARRLRVDLAELRFANDDAQGVVSGSYRTGGKGPGIVDLQGRLSRADASRAVRYLPLGIPESVRDWVGAAVTAGRSDDVRWRLRGDLVDFPYRRPADGEFSVNARLLDTTLRYAPGWPAIERFEGNLVFERAGMRIGMRSGQVFGVTLGRTEATLADFNDPMLRIQGAGEGPAEDLIRFVNQSPVATRIDDFTRDTAARGDARLALRLDLPLDDLDRSRVAGTVTFLGNELRLDKTVPPLSAVTGALEFSEKGLALRGIDSTFLGGTLRVEGETSEPGSFAIRAEGTVPASGIRQVSDNPLTRALDGQASYRASVDVRRRAASLLVESDLAGLASSLPLPFTKRAGEPWPLRVRVLAAPASGPRDRSMRDAIRVDLRDDIRLALERERDPGSEKLLIRRAAFATNADPVLPDSGLSIALNTSEVDVDAWLALLSPADIRDAQRPAASGFAEGFSLQPNLVSVVADRVRVAGKDLNAVVLGASRSRDLWQANIAAREVGGYFSWRDAQPGHRSGALTARFTKLEIPRSRAGEVESLLDTPPEELPALDIAADEFVLFDRRLGSLALRATSSPGAARPVWTLNELRIANPSASFRASGASEPADNGRSTRLRFDLDMTDAGGLLAVYGLKDTVRNGAGSISGDLRWKGSPLALDYRSLGGNMTLKLGRGQFLKTEPGIAKLIGVLNLQSLPRRLTLDFRDVFAEGFAFDEIAGDVAIERGVARTESLVMRGVQARVRIQGSADIAAETQSLGVEVRPELNAGLASIAYGAMVNPVVGLGSFVAQLALSSPIQQIFTYDYGVTGSWADPVVVERRRPQVAIPRDVTTP